MEERTQTHPTHKWAWYDFVLEENTRKLYCSECPRAVPAGEKMYVHRKGGKVMKRICSEQCGQEFDYRMMRAAARNRAEGKSRWT